MPDEIVCRLCPNTRTGFNVDPWSCAFSEVAALWRELFPDNKLQQRKTVIRVFEGSTSDLHWLIIGMTDKQSGLRLIEIKIPISGKLANQLVEGSNFKEVPQGEVACDVEDLLGRIRAQVSADSYVGNGVGRDF